MKMQESLDRIAELQVENLDLARRISEVRTELRAIGMAVFASTRHLCNAGEPALKFACGGSQYEVNSNGEVTCLDKALPHIDENAELIQ